MVLTRRTIARLMVALLVTSAGGCATLCNAGSMPVAPVCCEKNYAWVKGHDQEAGQAKAGRSQRENRDD